MAAKKAPIRIEGVTTAAQDEHVANEAQAKEAKVAEPAAPKAEPAKSAPKKREPKAEKPKVDRKPADVPRASIDTAPVAPSEDAAAAAPEEQAQAPQQEQEPAHERPSAGAIGWVSRMFPGNEHAVYGGIVGLVMAVLIFVVGFWQMLFVSALVVAGVALGQALDGDPKIIKVIRRLIRAVQGSDSE